MPDWNAVRHAVWAERDSRLGRDSELIALLLATILRRYKAAFGKIVDRTADKIGMTRTIGVAVARYSPTQATRTAAAMETNTVPGSTRNPGSNRVKAMRPDANDHGGGFIEHVHIQPDTLLGF